jgi:HSP20 family protein
MAITRWNPLRTMAALEWEMHDLRQRSGAITGMWHPAVDAYGENGTLVVQAGLPGLDPEKDIEVEVTDNVLRVRGRRAEETERRDEDTFVRERRVGSFCRDIALPDGVDTDRIAARYRDGVPTVSVPMPEDAAGGSGTIHVDVSGEEKA